MGDLRYNKNLALMAGVEATYGTEQATFVATDAVLLTEEPDVNIEWINVPRKLALPFFGASEELPATALVKMKFKVELVASGVAGTPPAVGKMLRGCGFQETVFAANRVEYTLLSQAQEGLTFRFYNDGVRYVSKAGRGRVKLDLTAYQIPTGEFEFWSLGRVETVAANPTFDYTAFKLPEVITDAASGDIKLGSALAAGVLTGGTSYKSKGIVIDVANKLTHYPLLGGEDIGIADREITGQIITSLSEAQEVQWYTDVRAITTSTLSFSHGTVAGAKMIAFGQKVQRTNPRRVNNDGRLMQQTDLRYIPVGADNELRLVFK